MPSPDTCLYLRAGGAIAETAAKLDDKGVLAAFLSAVLAGALIT